MLSICHVLPFCQKCILRGTLSLKVTCMNPHVVTDSQLLARPIHCCPAEVCVWVLPAACRAAPGLSSHLPGGIWGAAKTSWRFQELGAK